MGYVILKSMAKRVKKRRTRKITDWNIGMPLDFPPPRARSGIDRVAREVVEEAMRGPFRKKRKQK